MSVSLIKKIIKLLLSTITISVLFLYCDSDHDQLDSNLRGYLSEVLGQYRGVDLDLQTEKEYPYCNYSIDALISSSQQTVEVKILGIEIPNTVLPAFGSATGNWYLGNLNGDVSLRFRYQNKLSIYNLNISNKHISITPSIIGFTNLDTDTIFRIPTNFIWSYMVFYTVTESLQSAIRESFLNNLRNLGATDTLLTMGKYRHKINNNIYSCFTVNNYQILDPSGVPLYGFSYYGDTLPLKQLLNQYHELYSDYVYIWITTWHGRRFYMW